jgi:predicted DNA-binding transcriptional regulator AlpA
MRAYLKTWRAALKAEWAAEGLIDRHDTAALLGTTVRTLQRWHHNGHGPKRVPGGGREHLTVLYRRSEVEQWMSTKMQHLHGSEHHALENDECMSTKMQHLHGHSSQEAAGVDVH